MQLVFEHAQLISRHSLLTVDIFYTRSEGQRKPPRCIPGRSASEAAQHGDSRDPGRTARATITVATARPHGEDCPEHEHTRRVLEQEDRRTLAAPVEVKDSRNRILMFLCSLKHASVISSLSGVVVV